LYSGKKLIESSVKPEGRFCFQRVGTTLADYRIALTARESTPPNPMITVSSNNQTIGVILDFIRHLLIGFVCRQTGMYTVYNKQEKKASCLSVPGMRTVSA
jgi:hypothetical protein